MSNKKSNTKELLNPSIAIGKRKEESGMLALSLQDVFSDSANLAGRQKKTLPLFETEQGKEAQLQKKEGQNPRTTSKGGRKKLQANQKRTIKLQIHVNAREYEILTEQHQISGLRYLSDYLRILILDEKKSRIIINKKKLIKQLDGIGAKISKIGNNINQIAKYANIQNKSGKVDQNTMIRFEKLMQDYLKEQRMLINAYRALVRNKE